MEFYDAIVIGGGPAGAASALSLLTHYNRRVLLLERGDFSQARIGEQVSHSIFDFLAYLDLSVSEFGESCFTPNYGKTSLWGSSIESHHLSMFATQGATYQLDRAAFDETLLMAFVERGGTVIPRCKQMKMEQRDSVWQVQFVHPEQGEQIVGCDYLVDASGRQSKLGAMLGYDPVMEDQLIGVGAFIRNQDNAFEQHQRIESCEYGWWYMAGLSSELAVVTCFTDMDIMRKLRLNKASVWNQYLAETGVISDCVKGSETTHPKLWVKQAHSQYYTSELPDRFIAVGDAALSFDPVSSMGIGFAMTSACHGARALVSGSQDAVMQYQQDMARIYQEYHVTKTRIYQREKRWPNQLFWQRRHASSALQHAS